jgi:carbon-monoxide dehydrogenase medium subunit
VKAAPFAYVRPATLDDAVAELAATGGEGKVLAGGQSLVPVLAMRLGRPDTLVDINAVAGLDAVERRGAVVRVGATARQRQVERSPLAAGVPLLRLALPFVGHRELRSRGTVCGSLAHADPGAELPAVASCLGATLEVTGPRGRRTVPAAEFFLGAMTTALAPDEVLTAVEFPVAGPGEGFGFAELARRHGDFALAGVVAQVRCTGGAVAQAVLSGFGVSDRPVTREVTALVAAAAGEADVAAALRPATEDLARALVDTAGDGHGSRDYRRRLFAVLAARELASALAQALAGAQHRETGAPA